jgi:acyl carrier protein
VAQDTTGGLHAFLGTILAEELEIDPAELSPAADFVETYGADSLTVLAVIARIERDLGILIPTEEAAEMTTFEAALALAERHRAAAAPNA